MSRRCEPSGAGRRADLYSALGDQRNLGCLGRERPTRVFSGTGSRQDIAGNAAKCDVFGPETSYFSDNKDLLAEKGEFEQLIHGQVYI